MPKILLAEDDDTMVSLLTTLLKMEKYEVVSMIGTSEKVIDFLRRENPDVLLLDVHMPYENGIDVMRAIRKDDELKETRVVMTSGMELRVECKDAGANAFLLKPYMVDDLISTIQKIML